MNTAYLNSHDFAFYSDAQEQFENILSQLQSEDYSHFDHGQIEQHINKEGVELMRHLLQGWLNMKADCESRHSGVTAANGENLNHVKSQTSRTLTSLFGKVRVSRHSYSQRQQTSVFPFDAELNLAKDQYSDGLRYRIAKEAIRGSFDDTVETIRGTTGGHVPKRQSQKLVKDIAQDFESYYQSPDAAKAEETQDLLVLSFDGKGIVMRPDSLRFFFFL